ncbi:MAG: DUF1287 domain-containing protein [Pseudomonadota bacterium]
MDKRTFLMAGAAALVSACRAELHSTTANEQSAPDPDKPLHLKLAHAAEARLSKRVVYDPAYIALDYPGGDPPDDRGVCTDVVVRAYRGVGVDLQRSVHEDMTDHFSDYPAFWGLSRPDANIDHRRVPNLETYFSRQGALLGANVPEDDLQPGDIVSWRVDRLPHIAVASSRRGGAGRVRFVHNIGAGPQLDACYDAWPRTGVFRYRPWLV